MLVLEINEKTPTDQQMSLAMVHQSTLMRAGRRDIRVNLLPVTLVCHIISAGAKREVLGQGKYNTERDQY